ncbi:PREDICTED: uncharacterized protein LOC109467258 [Branchiostoma belcheri]|uniref:Uncharacterized protein LOC109467258 n=1 Tax=Branchiostoma belcheri TaxID=7741 RepID=A0A6P4XVT9_BRABE|nr:PREDICTED: uncharacterized protein LOC109467258 [Branchiostoma belcheri]
MKYSGLAQEFHQLLRNVDRISAGQAAVEDWGSAPLQFGVCIVPKDGLYRRGRFTFKFSLHDQYPQYPPRVVCLTNIYHPNIDTVDEYEGEICLSLLDEWQPTFTLEDVIIGLLFLLYHPNLEDPLSPLLGTAAACLLVRMTCFISRCPQDVIIGLLFLLYHPNLEEPSVPIVRYCSGLFYDVIIGLLFLLYHPNLEEPLSPFFEPCMNWEEFAEKVRLSLQGGVVEDYYFQRNQVDDGEVHDGTGPRGTNQEPVAMVKPRATNREPVAMVKPRATNREQESVPMAIPKGREPCGHLDVLR